MIEKGKISKRPVYTVVAVLFTAIILCGFAGAGRIFAAVKPQAAETAVSPGYRAVCYDGAVFIAVGAGGRIDRIEPDKTMTSLPAVTKECLNGAASSKGIDVAVGDGGVILRAKDGSDFKKVKSGTTRSLYGVTVFNGSFWAAGASGTLLCSSDGEHWKSVSTGVKNKFLSIAANEKMCMAVTGEGQILMSSDGRKWNVLDYNTFYKGYSEPCSFRSVRACEDAFFVAGEYQNHPEIPAILSSETGEIWNEHIFSRINEKPAEEYYPLVVNAVIVDWDQLIAACSGGKLLTVTECITCNELDILCEQSINDLVSADGFLALVGDNFWFDICKSDAFRQYSISAVQALNDYNDGALIVDVRTDDEYDQMHITGCIHIPLDEVEALLENVIPDKDREIIFYCKKGARAQSALEKALLMGYRRVYNLGGLEDWPYDTEATGISDVN